jgi:hypothetical protein
VSALALVGWSGVAALVCLWLAVSFMKPGPQRERVEWLAAVAMYVALLSLFSHLVLRAHGNGSWLGRIGFGFLWLVFSGGLLVSLANALRSGRGVGKSQAGATH